MARNLVVCLDGTSNEPESGTTNVARTYAVAVKSESQLVYYDPGVGTMGARGAVTSTGKKATRVAGLVVGFGVKDNIEEAYTWLSTNYQRGDRIFVFGFSRGAYTARALTGMLRTVGLLRPGVENLTPYALKLYAQHGPENPTPEQETDVFRPRRLFNERFGNPDFPNPFNPHVHQVRFLGVWDTVKTIGWLNLKAQFEQARWPSTRRILNVEIARHAMALDERRRPYPVYRFDKDVVASTTTTVSPTSRSAGWSTRRSRRGSRSTRRRSSGWPASRSARRPRPTAWRAPCTPTARSGACWAGARRPRPPECGREGGLIVLPAFGARLPGLTQGWYRAEPPHPRRRTLPTWGTCDACPSLGCRDRGDGPPRRCAGRDRPGRER